MVAFPSITVMNRGYRSSHQNQPGKNGYRQYARSTLPSPTKKSSSWLDQTLPSLACWPRYEGGLSPPGRLEMSYKVTQASTQRYSEASSKPWLKAFDMARLITPGRRNSLKKPS